MGDLLMLSFLALVALGGIAAIFFKSKSSEGQSGSQKLSAAPAGISQSKINALKKAGLKKSKDVPGAWDPEDRPQSVARKGAAIKTSASSNKDSNKTSATSGGSPPLMPELPPIHEPLQVSGRRSSILLVEDSPTASLAMRRLLEERGYRVQVAENGRLGWVQLQKDRPDLLISDIDMPEMNGIELLRLIRGDIKLSGLPVVLVTGNPYFYIQVGQAEGVDGFLPKPFADQDLVQQVQYLLQE
jgi:CheY-like chemotaxis protein